MNITIINNKFKNYSEFLAISSFLRCIFFMPLGTAPTFLFMALTMCFWIFSGKYTEKINTLVSNKFAQSVFIFVLIFFLGVIYSNANYEEIIYQISKYTKLFFILVGLSLIKDRKWQKLGINIFCVAMLITLLLSLTSVIFPLNFIKATFGGASNNHFVFKDHIAQNLLMSYFVLVMLVKSQETPSIVNKFISIGIAFLAIIDIVFFVQGRTGYISLAANIVLFLVYFSPRKKIGLYIALTLFISFLLFGFSKNFTSRIELAAAEFQNKDSKQLTSVGQRVEFFTKSLELIKEKPILGWGTGSYAQQFCRVAISDEWCQAGKFHPHNQFMAIGVQLGLLGIGIFIYFLWSAIEIAKKLDLSQKVLALGLIATLIVDSFLHAPLFLVSEAQFFIIMLGLLLPNHFSEKSI
jgi:O-antigen ligase